MKYLLIDITEQSSRLNGGTMWRLEFYCLDDGTTHEMTVDGSYRNFQRQGWAQVVQNPNPWGVYTKLKRTKRVTRKNIPVVSADSPVNQEFQCQDQAQAQALMQLDLEDRKPVHQLDKIFSFE
jgi:hypothetical protein